MAAALSATARVAALSIFLCSSAAAAEIATQTFIFGGHQRSASTYFPDKTRDSAAPVLVLLHGSFQTGLIMAQLWQAEADQEGIVLVAPDAITTDHWSMVTDPPAYINAAIAVATAGHRVDPRRIYLFGQSAGAVYALTLAMMESKYFAAVAIHAGAWRHVDEFDLMRFAVRKTPLMIIVGDQDEFFPLLSVRRTQHAFENAGFPIVVDIVTAQHHWFDIHTAPEIDATSWAFLKTHALDQDPQFINYNR